MGFKQTAIFDHLIHSPFLHLGYGLLFISRGGSPLAWDLGIKAEIDGSQSRALPGMDLRIKQSIVQ